MSSTASPAVYRRGRHDGIVAMGGGSALDTGKVIAFMAGQTRGSDPVKVGIHELDALHRRALAGAV